MDKYVWKKTLAKKCNQWSWSIRCTSTLLILVVLLQMRVKDASLCDILYSTMCDIVLVKVTFYVAHHNMPSKKKLHNIPAGHCLGCTM